jgi:predicted CXXCH cytochrome family protein
VYTNGPGDLFVEFEVAYTFGWWPLQQYLIPFENGKYQTLHMTWDSRDNRWYDMSEAVYQDEDILSDNWLHWTNQAQNWNGMCADCHSTHLRKNYDHNTDSYQTVWSDINVNCEACHGPGSAHLDWAALPELARPTDNNTALVVVTRDMPTREYADLCARCHMRRSALGDFDHFGGSLLDHYIPQLTGEPYYYSDGQILEEDYVYGSFLQSKMFTNDVKCNDCHDAHSLKLIKSGNDLCLQCHRPEVYDSYNHHFHKKKDNPRFQEGNHRQMYNVEGEGALCINCHMDGGFFMGVDYRRDHSFRIPRPDLTLSLGVPNACNSCHTDKSAQWSEDYITQWYGKSRPAHYGTTIAGGEDGDPAALDGLIFIANASEDLYPVMIRATALSLLANYPDEKAKNTLALHLSDEDPIMRHYAVRNLNPASIEEFTTYFVPMLYDPVKAVRTEAALKLSQLPAEARDSSWVKPFDEALAEYEAEMIYTADFAPGSFNLANLYYRQGKIDKAESNFKKALAIDNLFFPAKVNLAMMYNSQQKNQKAVQLFREVIRDHPEQYDIYYSLGLLLAEMNNLPEAAEALEQAAGFMPYQPRIAYNLGLIYQYLNQNKKAEQWLLKAYELEPENGNFIYALADFYSKTGQQQKADEWMQMLPGN